MNLNSLAKKAAKGSAPAAHGGAMEVEDMIDFVLFHGAAAADEIERLLKQHQWGMEAVLPDGSRVVPFGRWALACIAFGRGGVAALMPLLSDPGMASFAVGLLQEVRTPESVEALVDYVATASFEADGPEHPAWAEWKALLALNSLLAFDDFVPVREYTSDKLRQILIFAYERAATSPRKSNALAAMRGVPSEVALEWVQGLKDLDPELKQLQRMCVKAFQKRLAPDFKPLKLDEQRQLRRQRAANA